VLGLRAWGQGRVRRGAAQSREPWPCPGCAMAGHAEPGRGHAEGCMGRGCTCTRGRGSARGDRGDLTTGSMDDNNGSPGSNLGQGERWREVEERVREVAACERENEGEGCT
jgi:hypothetical protein